MKKHKTKFIRRNKSVSKSVLHKAKGPSPQEINNLVYLFNQGQWADAVALAQAMTVRFPTHGFGWKLLGAMLKLQGRNAEALGPMQKAVALLPRDAEAHSNLGITLKEQGRLIDAEASYCRALEIKPDFAEARYNLGNTQGARPARGR
jgi:protein O-GlcNAc transferase